MLAYTVRRFFQGLLVVFLVTVVTFSIPTSFHKNIARLIYGPKIPQEVIDKFNHDNYFDKSVFVQYLHYMNNLLHGNLGVSFDKENYGLTVSSILGPALWDTFWLVLAALVISVLIAVPLGLAQGLKRNSAFDYITTGIVFVIYSTPAFVLGMLLIIVFSIKLGWFPAQVQTSGVPGPLSRLEDMFKYPNTYVLPVAALAGLTIGGFSRFMRGSTLDTLVQDYIRTARAKGASPRRILYRHAFRNAVIPIVTILGLTLPALFAGAVITETLFNIDGMGHVTVQAVHAYDVPMLMASTLLIAVATVIGNFVSDVSVALIDPRIRLTGKR